VVKNSFAVATLFAVVIATAWPQLNLDPVFRSAFISVISGQISGFSM